MIVGVGRAEERGEDVGVEPVDDHVDVAPWGGGSLSPAGGGGKHDGHALVVHCPWAGGAQCFCVCPSEGRNDRVIQPTNLVAT